MDHYRNVLRHIIRPDNVRKRTSSNQVYMEDWQALYFTDVLRSYAAYGTSNELYQNIAKGYREYINMVVRDEGWNGLPLYAHTNEAWDVLMDASHRGGDVDVVDKQIRSTVRNEFIQVFNNEDIETLNESNDSEVYNDE